jgi:hypothetical protein
MIFICIYHPSLWTFTCSGGAPCLIVYAPKSHTLSNYRLLCNSWLVQWQSADGGSCSTLQGIASIVFAGGNPIEDCLAGLLHSLGSCPGNSYRQSSFPDEERSLFPSNDHIHLQYIFCFCLTWHSLLFCFFFWQNRSIYASDLISTEWVQIWGQKHMICIIVRVARIIEDRIKWRFLLN